MSSYLVVYETISGNTKTFVDYLTSKYPANYTIISPKEFQKGDYVSKEWDAIFLGSYTWDEGKIPVKTKRAVILHREWLSAQNLFIFGTGWTMYSTYCKAVDSLQVIVGREVPHIKYELKYAMKQNRECDEIVENFINQTEKGEKYG